MNQRQLQMIDYLCEENRLLREQPGDRRLRLSNLRGGQVKLTDRSREVASVVDSSAQIARRPVFPESGGQDFGKEALRKVLGTRADHVAGFFQ